MSKIFNIYLMDKGTSSMDWGEGDMSEVGMQLTNLFDQVCKHSDSDFTVSDFWWNPSANQVLDHELLVYFLPDASHSVIAAAQNKYKVDTTRAGNTYHYGSKGRISEVYLDKAIKFIDAHLLLAKLCFHELMHNKLEPFNVHTKGGGGLASDAPITSSTPLTEENKKLMAKALSKKVRQYKGGL